MSLFPCPSCARHVLARSTSCPFCSARIPVSVARAPARGWPTERLGRAATFKLGAAAVAGATTLLGCGDDDGSSMALYGAPPEDSSISTDTGARDMASAPDTGAGDDDAGPTPVDMGMAVDAGPPDGPDLGGDVPLYGAPPEDAGMTDDDAGPTIDDGGGPAPLYGAVPFDAGPEDQDGGGGMALYGAPAPDSGPSDDRDDGGIAALYGAVPADP